MGRSCSNRTCTTCCYIRVVVMLVSSLDRHIMITSKDTTDDIAGRVNARTHRWTSFTNMVLTMGGIVM